MTYIQKLFFIYNETTEFLDIKKVHHFLDFFYDHLFIFDENKTFKIRVFLTPLGQNNTTLAYTKKLKVPEVIIIPMFLL